MKIHQNYVYQYHLKGKEMQYGNRFPEKNDQLNSQEIYRQMLEYTLACRVLCQGQDS